MDPGLSGHTYNNRKGLVVMEVAMRSRLRLSSACLGGEA